MFRGALVCSRAVRTVALANQTRFIQVLNLPYDVVPEMCTRAVVGTRDHNPASGERSVRAHRKRISGSVTLMPKGTPGDVVRGLPESVLKAPDVERALKMWPPKIAAKTLSKDEREAEDKERAAAEEEQAKLDKAHAEALKRREAKLAKRAAGETAEVAPAGDRPTVPTPMALAPELAAAAEEKSKVERVARKTPKE